MPTSAEAALARLNVELLPGTEIMEDMGGLHFQHGGKSDVVLVPQPSSSPHDPLNWSMTWKLVAIANQAFFCLVSVMAALSLSPMTPYFMETFGVDINRVTLYTGVCIIALGYSNFWIVPVCNVFGRRFASLLCAALCMASLVWMAVAKTDGSFMGARALNGIGAAANESIMAIVAADIFFLHERGTFMGLYFACYFSGLYLGPIISGEIASKLGWRWFFWVCLILQGVSTIFLAVAFPETHFGAPTITADAAFVDVLKADGEVEHKEDTEASGSSKDAPAEVSHVGRGRPSKGQFALLHRPDQEQVKRIWQTIYMPFLVIFNPIILWASCVLGGTANSMLAANISENIAFAGPPYNFTPSQVGLTNLSLLVGGFIGLFTAGPFSDWVSARATRKNHDIREPEMRLASLIPYGIVYIIGMVVLGVGLDQGWPWEAVIIVGFGCIGLSTASLPTIAITYAVDCYKPMAGEILCIATVIKNTFGFGMTYWVVPLALGKGFINPVMILFALTTSGILGGIVLFFSGKDLRRLTKDSSLHRWH